MKLSKSRTSKKYLEAKYGQKSRHISKKMQQDLEQAGIIANKKIALNNAVYNQSNAHSNETIVGEQTHAERFAGNIENMKNPHLRDCVSLGEREGTIENYSFHQEQQDLKHYKEFLNSSAFDEVRGVETDVESPMTLAKLRKRSGEHDS